MSQPAEKQATYEDIVALPENLVGELIHGQLHATPRPAPKHARASSSLGDELVSPYDKGRGGPGGWWILDEPEPHFGSNVLVPDLAGWRRERMPRLPDTAWFELPPDWVCEILSPSTARLDRGLKMPLYTAQKIPHLWLVDPDARLLEVYELHGGWPLDAAGHPQGRRAGAPATLRCHRVPPGFPVGMRKERLIPYLHR